jgi:hypothetical protein
MQTNAYEDSRRTHVGKGARSDGGNLERQRPHRRGTGQRHPDREREAWVRRLAADQVARHDDEIYELGWHRRRGIEAYASHTSVKAGDTLNVHVSTYAVNTYSVSIYRMGYYGGAGARLMRTLGPLQGTAEPTPQDGVRNLIECNWKVGFSLEIPRDWLSGVYLGKLSTLPSATGQYLDLEMDFRRSDPRIQRITRNVLDRMIATKLAD